MRQGLRSRILRALLCLAFAGACPVLAQSKTLHWRSLEVRAHLDGQGRLQIVERHDMVFTGDWNGGERVFRLFPGQRLALTRVARIDAATGEARDLALGDLSQVDQYAWKDEHTLRWRSRQPSDPPFDNTEIVTEIAYTLSGILFRAGNDYVLDNDFAFPDRSGVIERFTLDLDLDPAWRPQGTLPPHQERKSLVPGESYVVRERLQYVGAGRPEAVRRGTSAGERWAVFVLLAGSFVGLFLAFWRREAALGRFAPPPASETVDARWLEQNVFTLRPEEAGALWDESIGAPEVAAVIARWNGEKKVQARAEGKTMTMKRLVPIAHFDGYERELAEALFFSGREETDTDAIKAHYRSSGFDPADKIRSGLQKQLDSHGEFNDRSPRPARWPTALLLVIGVGALVLCGVFKVEEPGTLIGLAITHLFLYVAGLIPATMFQKRIDGLAARTLTFLWVPLVLLAFSLRGVFVAGRSSEMLLFAVLLLRLGMINNILNVAKTRDGARKIARRKALAAARRFFQRELAGRSPRLSDSWYPYILAFGLGPAADRWAHAFGAAAQGAMATSSSHSSSSSSSGSSAPSGGWSGGGGSFGGGGSSASWAAAAGAMAAGVSAPSSSGGGGGGGGGGSSGGGGGGGW